jgi:hypothetical protein
MHDETLNDRRKEDHPERRLRLQRRRSQSWRSFERVERAGIDELRFCGLPWLQYSRPLRNPEYDRPTHFVAMVSCRPIMLMRHSVIASVVTLRMIPITLGQQRGAAVVQGERIVNGDGHRRGEYERHHDGEGKDRTQD